MQVSATDEREIEVVAAGLPAHYGAQLAVDITLRSAVTSVGALGQPLPQSTEPHCHKLAGTKKRPSTQSWWRANGADLSWALETCGSGARRLWSSWQTWHLLARGMHQRCCDVQRFWRGGRGGQGCWSVLCARAFATSLVVSHTDAWAGVDGRRPILLLCTGRGDAFQNSVMTIE